MRMIARLMVAVVTLGATLLTGGSAHAADSVKTYNVWQWNVSGWKMNGGSTTNGMVDAAADSIRTRDSDFAAFNELCWSQYQALQKKLIENGWVSEGTSFARFAAIRNGEESDDDPACNEEPFGIAIFSRRDLGTAEKYDLPKYTQNVVYKLLCAPLVGLQHMRFCTTHITSKDSNINGSPINEQQLNAVQEHLEDLYNAGNTVIIAGDFNARPHLQRLNDWYSPTVNGPNNHNNTGAYRELDDLDPRCPGVGEPTTLDTLPVEKPCNDRPKIDMIFVRESLIAGAYSGDALGEGTGGTACGGGPCSDHRVLIGTVTVRVKV
ncbi:endonuclease/exonuclease/phosphatase family protein [Nonomuraea angiospora]|uniref:Endonuclease/exonuclease/phosphatase family metal-dependent hydrolase n=1 Tax=Nonomuraea angiospora TaxID=46172 RepID=A0ABR9LU02_9ACTN|nr:endonuclease/exonuclease/phosphatase family protein [Nonomuraea angiospora]MBE1583782.1 endonuclease/exonuclease/phosphatase family metal-dependent hydrolase [Nonomuraea angiospora]